MKLSDVVAKYIEYRDMKAALKAEYDLKAAKIDEQLEKIEAKLLEVLDQTGGKSFSTPAGTAYISVRSSASVADREAFMEFVKRQEEWPLLEVRASKTGVQQFRDLNNDLPPGINWREERVVNIRRS
jgi:cell division GTPase FtsZ